MMRRFFILRIVALGCALILLGAMVDLGCLQAFAQQAAAATDSGVYGPAPVTAPANDQPNFLSSFMNMMPLIAMCYLIFYFMVVKPQDSKAKTHKALIESLKKGDTVITSGGIVGKIAGNEADYVILEIASNVKVKVEPGHILKRPSDEPKAKAA